VLGGGDQRVADRRQDCGAVDDDPGGVGYGAVHQDGQEQQAFCDVGGTPTQQGLGNLEKRSAPWQST
jgi:hypothetical protein